MEIFPKPLSGKLPIWRAVGGPPASAVKAGRMGIPMMLAVLGGPASAFKTSVNMYRQVAAQSGFNPAELPVGTTTLLYIDKDSQQAFRNYYPYLNHMMKELRGSAYPKDQFAEAMSVRNALLVGSPQQVIEKSFINMSCTDTIVFWLRLILVVYLMLRLSKSLICWDR